ncbi:hypothetical protein GCM10027271_53280 [Saccharopolyspora gloriosae]|uniref:YbaB/EbfC DNA-binding family protein n=1 Tax=Saccharopolyspora gloriosae TaxID=455344 RepID=A0A840N957_9PSEU|nr:hypothetical protein [Saccharopolyspora gloriosae]MBB5068706.1 hypothetical protein [Saccharopolyspora gloriosae]
MGDGRSVKTLIAIAESLPANRGLAAGMAEIRGTATGEGISLSVDLNGLLTELTVSEQAIALGPQRLAAEITRLSAEACAESTRRGLVALEWGCGRGVAAAIGERLAPAEQPGTPARTRGRDSDEDDEDFTDSSRTTPWASNRPAWGR